MRAIAFVASAILLLASCTGSPPPSAVPTTAPTSQATPAATPVASPTSLAILDGEPWLAFGWRKEPGGWYVGLMRADGSDAHEILSDVPG